MQTLKTTLTQTKREERERKRERETERGLEFIEYSTGPAIAEVCLLFAMLSSKYQYSRIHR
jgi:hypothetical protein